jgi:hypothetical protein
MSLSFNRYDGEVSCLQILAPLFMISLATYWSFYKLHELKSGDRDQP